MRRALDWIKAAIIATAFRVAAHFGYRQIGQCPACGRWYPVWSDDEEVLGEHLLKEMVNDG